MKRFEDRVAVVTGAASGIGRALALELAGRGCHLALADVEEQGLEESGEAVRALGRRASVHRVDVADRERMRAFAAEVEALHGAAHVLVNNAGVSVTAPFVEQSLEDMDWIVGINFWGVVHGCKFFLPTLLRQDEAHIVNLSSLFGLLGLPTQSSYNATKFAVRGLSESLFVELARTPVRVLCVHPGGVRTRIVEDSRTYDADAKARAAGFFERRGMAPERAAVLILRAMEQERMRVLVCRETYVTDWLKRLAPEWTQRLVALGAGRSGLAGGA